MIRKSALQIFTGFVFLLMLVTISGIANAAPANPVAPGLSPTNAGTGSLAARQYAQLRRRVIRRGVRVVPRPAVRAHRAARVLTRRRGWRGRHWGTVAYGVTLGTVIVVAANTPPPPPHASLCWTWADGVYRSGYWYYCSGE